MLKRNFEHTLEREEERQKKILAEKSQKLDEMMKHQQMEIERKKKEYEDKHNEVLLKLKEKHQQEMMTCLS